MVEGATIAAVGGAMLHELALFAACGFFLGGIDELAIDIIWGVRTLWRRAAIYSRYPRAHADGLSAPARPGRIAVFIPAWDESAVIEQMLRTTLGRFGADDFRLYIGCYPNDQATIAIVRGLAAEEPRVRPVLCTRPGPTNKADCLNHLWRAVLDDERHGDRIKAVLLHDAEDVVHRAELRVLDSLIERFDFVQFPVLPMAQPRTLSEQLISGHYCDEFAEAHGKLIVVREALGAAIPSAGVGCGIARDVLARLAARAGGLPFDTGSLTEDYELGLRIGEAGGRCAFVRLPVRSADGHARGIVAVREHFPASFDAAVRQKARWVVGISLAGWDRLGWRGGLAERWMRMHDRRALVAALILATAYGALLLWSVLTLGCWIGLLPLPDPGLPSWIVWTNLALAGWRALVRFGFVAGAYGWRWAAGVPARLIVSNIVAMAAAWRALLLYWRSLRGSALPWEKTSHVFPAQLPAE